MTSDVEAAKAFYTKVVGWQTEDAATPGIHTPGLHSVQKVGEVHAAGLMALTEDARNRRVPPCWTGYVAVDDVDAGSEKFKKHGGAVRVPPARFQMLAASPSSQTRRVRCWRCPKAQRRIKGLT